jgi:hypothetical protein
MFLLLLHLAAFAQDVAPQVTTHSDIWGVGGGGVAGLLSAVLALLVKDKLLSQKHPEAAQGITSDLQTRVTRLELQLEALRDTQRDLRQLTETLGQLIRDLAAHK